MSKDFKPLVYYYVRRGWSDQLLSYCNEIIDRKGKDPFATFWKAYAYGVTGNIAECLRQLDGFQSRRDMQYPVSLAMIYFHKRANIVDHEVVDSLQSGLSMTEDIVVRCRPFNRLTLSGL